MTHYSDSERGPPGEYPDKSKESPKLSTTVLRIQRHSEDEQKQIAWEVDATPNDELRALIQEWREKETLLNDLKQTDYGEGQRITYGRLANEIEELIENNE